MPSYYPRSHLTHFYQGPASLACPSTALSLPDIQGMLYISHQETLLGSGYFPKLSFGDKIITRLSSKILLMHGWIVILQDISDGRIIPRVSTPSIANRTFFWQCPHSINHKKAFDTCFIRREDRFISHPCRISAYSKWLPSNIEIQASSKITSKSHRVIILPSPAPITIHFSREMFSSIHSQLSAVKGNSHLKQMLIRLAAETPYLEIYIGLTETSWWSANWSCLIYSSAQTIPVSLSSFPPNQSQLHIFAALP